MLPTWCTEVGVRALRRRRGVSLLLSANWSADGTSWPPQVCNWEHLGGIVAMGNDWECRSETASLSFHERRPTLLMRASSGSSRQHPASCPLKSVQIKSLQASFVPLLALVLTQFYFWHFPCRLWSRASSIWRLIWDSVFLVALWKSPLMAWFIPVMLPRCGKRHKNPFQR